MKLSDVYLRPLKEVLEKDCEVVDQKIHTDENGVVMSIEVKYRPLESTCEEACEEDSKPKAKNKKSCSLDSYF